MNKIGCNLLIDRKKIIWTPHFHSTKRIRHKGSVPHCKWQVMQQKSHRNCLGSNTAVHPSRPYGWKVSIESTDENLRDIPLSHRYLARFQSHIIFPMFVGKTIHQMCRAFSKGHCFLPCRIHKYHCFLFATRCMQTSCHSPVYFSHLLKLTCSHT